MAMTGEAGTVGREPSKQRFLFVGNHSCLDFINTQMIVRGNLTDLLGGYADFVDWLVRAKILSQAQASAVSTEWSHKEREQLLEQGILFRKTLRDIAERIVARRPISASSIKSINQLTARRPGYTQLSYAEGRFERRFQPYAAQKDGLLAPLAEAAIDLLCTGDLSLVKKCGNTACILYFYDTTKNHARNWCSMRLCGNRMKVAAHYRKKQRKAKEKLPRRRN